MSITEKHQLIISGVTPESVEKVSLGMSNGSGRVGSRPGNFVIVSSFLGRVGLDQPIPEEAQAKHLIRNLSCGLLKVDQAHRGHLTCFLSVNPFATNIYGGMHGGAVASVAEEVLMACARTVVGEEKELFLGEISISYLASAPRNAELKVEASVARSGKNVTVVAAEFRLKDSGNLTYTSRATFYNMPVSTCSPPL